MGILGKNVFNCHMPFRQFVFQTNGQINPNLHIYVKFHYQPMLSVLEHLESTDLGSQVLIGSTLQEEFDHGKMVLLCCHIQRGKTFLQTGDSSTKVMWHLYRTLFYPTMHLSQSENVQYSNKYKAFSEWLTSAQPDLILFGDGDRKSLPEHSTVYCIQLMLPTRTISTCISEVKSSFGPSWSKQTI